MEGRRNTGDEGEDVACRFLSGRGHTILSRNWRAGHLEIDIVSMDGDGIHFVEVKTRRPPMQALPQDSVTPVKQMRIARAANAYLNKVRNVMLNDAECHFDIVAVTIENSGPKVEYIPDAYYPMSY